MTDDVELNAMSGGAKVAADERSINSQTVKVQRVVGIGATAIANGQVAPTGTAGTLVAARETRARLILLNAGTVDVYVGVATVTAANGFKLAPGASVTLHTTALVQGITDGDTGEVHYIEEYDN